MRTVASLCAVAVLVSGCATAAKDVPTASVSSDPYRAMDCQQLGVQARQVVDQVQQLGGRLDLAARNDAALVAVGTILFWPVLFAVGHTREQEAQYAQLKGQAQAIHDAAVQQNCPMVPAEQLKHPGGVAVEANAQQEILGCVPPGSRPGDKITLRDYGDVQVRKLSSANTECGANGPTISMITATFVQIKQADTSVPALMPADSR